MGIIRAKVLESLFTRCPMREDLKMKYDPLLALPWSMLPFGGHLDAIGRAAQIGRDRAYYAIVASGGIDMCLEDGSIFTTMFSTSWRMKNFTA
jgi:hypothetical protein